MGPGKVAVPAKKSPRKPRIHAFVPSVRDNQTDHVSGFYCTVLPRLFPTDYAYYAKEALPVGANPVSDKNKDQEPDGQWQKEGHG